MAQHRDDFEPSSVKNGIFAYMGVGFTYRLRLNTTFSFIWGYWETELYSQKQQNHKLDRSLPKFYDLQGEELPNGTDVSGHAGSDQNSFYFLMRRCLMGASLFCAIFPPLSPTFGFCHEFP